MLYMSLASIRTYMLSSLNVMFELSHIIWLLGLHLTGYVSLKLLIYFIYLEMHYCNCNLT